MSMRKLTEAQVKFVVDNPMGLSDKKMSEKVGVDEKVLSRIRKGESYSDVTGIIPTIRPELAASTITISVPKGTIVKVEYV